MLEAYALKRLDPERIPSLENHLFACDSCQDALAEVDHLISTMKLVAEHVDQPLESSAPPAQNTEASPRSPSVPPAKPAQREIAKDNPRPFWSRLNANLRTPQFAGLGFACAAALVVFLAGGFHRFGPANAPMAAVTLSSYRGSVATAHAPAGAPLDLGIESTQLAVGAGFRIELVDAAGKSMWQGVLSDAGAGRFSAKVQDKFNAGMYWVRLYNLNAQLVQEFSLRLD